MNYKMSDDEKLFLFILIFTLVILVSIYKVTNNLKNACRLQGGVPIYNNGNMNCAKEGYIDIRQ